MSFSCLVASFKCRYSPSRTARRVFSQRALVVLRKAEAKPPPRPIRWIPPLKPCRTLPSSDRSRPSAARHRPHSRAVSVPYRSLRFTFMVLPRRVGLFFLCRQYRIWLAAPRTGSDRSTPALTPRLLGCSGRLEALERLGDGVYRPNSIVCPFAFWVMVPFASSGRQKCVALRLFLLTFAVSPSCRFIVSYVPPALSF